MDKEISTANYTGDFNGAEATDAKDKSRLEIGRNTAIEQLQTMLKTSENARTPVMMNAYVAAIQSIPDPEQKKQLTDFLRSEYGASYFDFRNAVARKMADAILTDTCPINTASHDQWARTHLETVLNWTY